MLAAPAFSTTDPQSYEQIGHRIRRIICDPKVQSVQAVVVERRTDESPAAWRRVISELADTAGILVDELGGDLVRINWRGYSDS